MASVLQVITTAVKMVAEAVIDGLPGLRAMDPGGEFITRINQPPESRSRFFASAADYEAAGGLGALATDRLVDRILGGAKNNLIVPTVGGYEGSAEPEFPVSETDRFVFPGGRAVGHSSYFEMPETSEKLLSWLN